MRKNALVTIHDGSSRCSRTRTWSVEKKSWSRLKEVATHVKKRVSEKVSPRVMHRIRPETLGKTLSETLWREKSRQESHQESRRESQQDSWRDFSCQRISTRVLSRVSDRILCMTLGEITSSGSCRSIPTTAVTTARDSNTTAPTVPVTVSTQNLSRHSRQ